MSDIGQSHFLGGSPLNRLSWLRNSPSFLTNALESSRTKWVLFNDGLPLVSISSSPSSSSTSTIGSPSSQPINTKKTSLTLLPTSTVLSLLGPKPYFAQGQNPGGSLPPELITTTHHGAGKFLEAARIHGPGIVFLGTFEDPDRHASSAIDAGLGISSKSSIADPQQNLALPPASDVSNNPQSAEEIRGDPYFSLDVTTISEDILMSVLELDKTFEETDSGSLKREWGDARAAGLALDPVDAAIFSVARTMSDWNARNKFCSSCGSTIYSLWGGWKLSCSSLLPWADNTGRAPCPTAKGLHNVMHPRTDAVVITAVLDESGDRILLGRNKRFPPGFYSTLAGFLEPSESIEEAVAREIWEESGVRVRDVRYHSCQPWPFPANLMVGCFAIADATQPIRTDLDNELEDAKWFTRDEVLAILETSTMNTIKRKEWKAVREHEDPAKKLLAPSESRSDEEDESLNVKEKDLKKRRESNTTGAEAKVKGVRVPGKTAIAGVLIAKFAYGELEGLGYSFPPSAGAKPKI